LQKLKPGHSISIENNDLAVQEESFRRELSNLICNRKESVGTVFSISRNEGYT
jgi:hypothetical protein